MEENKLSQQVPTPESQAIEPQKNINRSSNIKILVAILVVIVLGIVGFFAYKSLLPKQIVAKPKVIGLIYTRQNADAIKGLKAGMQKLGYTDKNLTYDEVELISRATLNEDAKNATTKMVADKVDVFFLSPEPLVKIAVDVTKQLGNNTPILFSTLFHDPVSYGLVQSYKSSGNNLTGVSVNLIPDIQKTLSFFKEINPNAKKVGIFTDGFMVPGNSEQLVQELKNQAPKFGLSIVEYKTQKKPTTTGENWHEVADKIQPGDIDAIQHLPLHYYDSATPGPGKSQEADEMLLAQRLHISHSVQKQDMISGGQFSFSDDLNASAGQVAVMIDKIFHGIKPSDIPIEFGAKSLLILNLPRAKAAGIQFPQSMLSVANEIIK